MNSTISNLVKSVEIPRFVKVKQHFERPRIDIDQISETIEILLQSEEFSNKILPEMNVCITAGSRGIANIDVMLKAIVDYCKERKAKPFIIPAMGSHGGATAEGQTDILTALGITEKTMGCPIVSSMETVQIGLTEEGHHVCIDKNAAAADAIIICCRIKPHTCFRGPFESGIMKMMTIGLGKQHGAEICHASGFKHMAHLIPLFGRVVRDNAPIVFAVASLENAFDETAKIVALLPEEFETKEPELLREAFSYSARIWFDDCDVLIVDQIGKDISGDGMDPNITGTFCTPYASGGIRAERVCVLGLTEASKGNGNGVGMAHVISKRLGEQFDPEISYPNAITSTVLQPVSIPMTMQNDKETIQMCIRTCNQADKKTPRVIRIKDSLHIEHIWISEAMLEEAKRNPNLEIENEPEYLPFNEAGNLW